MTVEIAKPVPQTDLAHVLQFARPDLEKLRGARIFVTGGTGFFGKWLVASFLHVNRELQLDASMTVLTRDPGKFREENPGSTADPSLLLHAGDVRTFAFPEGKFSHAILGASSAGSGPLDLFSTMQTKMPMDNPGSLKSEEYVDVVAYFFRGNAFPAGKDELTTDREQLKLIRIERKKS